MKIFGVFYFNDFQCYTNFPAKMGVFLDQDAYILTLTYK